MFDDTDVDVEEAAAEGDQVDNDDVSVGVGATGGVAVTMKAPVFDE